MDSSGMPLLPISYYMNKVDKVIFTGERYKHFFEFWTNSLLRHGNGFHVGYSSARGVKKNKNFNFTIPKSIQQHINRITKSQDDGLFTCMVATIAILLARYTRESNICLHSPLKVTSQNDVYSVVVPLTITVDQEKTLKDFLKNVNKEISACYTYQNFPLELIGSDETLFSSNVLISYQGLHRSTEAIVVSRYDLEIYIVPINDSLQIAGNYDSGVFGEDINDIEAQVCSILSCFQNYETSVKNVSLVSEAERQRILTLSIADRLAISGTLHGLFESQVIKNPLATALRCGNKKLAYSDVNAIANKLAKYLLKNYALQPEDRVGIMFDDPLTMIISILAILKTGAAYVPVDKAYPANRIFFMLTDTNAKVFITDNKEFHQEVLPGIEVWQYDQNIFHQYSTDNLVLDLSENSLAYIIYTSGSSGTPKGVMVEHRSVINLIKGLSLVLSVQTEWKFILTSSIAFDASVKQIFIPLTSGAELHVLDDWRDLNGLASYLQDEAITALHLSPEVWKGLLYHENLNDTTAPALQCISSGGDILPQDIANEIINRFPRAKFYNIYGPTEACINALWSPVTVKCDKNPPIGKPLPGYSTYILDECLNVQPFGVAGEICIAGVGIARGYINGRQLNDLKFVADHHALGERLYRTGDLGRLSENGNIEFLGRLDEQVKVRGYRIETQEIITAINSYKGVKRATVTVMENDRGEKMLVAYIVQEEPLNVEQLKNKLAVDLPAYMIPTYFIQVDIFPVSVNGKIDFRKLPHPEEVAKLAVVNTKPESDFEKGVAQIWYEVFGRDNFDTENNFFEIGGHSLMAIQLASRLSKAFNIQMTLKQIFSNPTIKSQASLISNSELWKQGNVSEKIPVALKQDHYELSFNQERFWVLYKLDAKGVAYNMPGAYIFKGKFDLIAIQAAFTALVQRHEILRTTFHTVNGKPRQIIHDDVHTFSKIECFDLTAEPEKKALADSICNEEVETPFNLEEGPLVRVKLVMLNQESVILIISLHHIISDGWSSEIFKEEILSLYLEHKENKDNTRKPLELQYKDYAVWHRKKYEDIKYSEYWSNVFKDIKDLNLPLDFIRPEVFSFKGERIEFSLEQSLSSMLNNFAATYGVTPGSVLFSVFNIILAKWAEQNDIIVGMAVSGRTSTEVGELIGPFMNTLPVRSYPNEHCSYLDYLTELNSALLRVYEEQDFPFNLLVKEYCQERDFSRNPVFNTIFNYHTTTNISHKVVAAIEASGLSISDISLAHTTSTLDLKMDVFNKDGAISFSVDYNSDLFKAQTIKSLLEKFPLLLKDFVAAPNMKIGEFRIFDVDDVRATNKITKNLQPKNIDDIAIDVHVISSFVADPIKDFVLYWSNELGYTLNVEFAPHNQVFQTLISLTNKNTINKINVILIRFEDWMKDAAHLATEEKINLLDEVSCHLQNMLYELSRSGAQNFLGIFPLTRHSDFAHEINTKIESLNRKWNEWFDNVKNIYSLDVDLIRGLYKVEEIADERSDAMANIPYTAEYYAALGTYIARKVNALKTVPYKVIALDCDNTLWKGICAEDGIEGIKVEEGNKYLQEFMIRKFNEGFLLVLCSKNNEDDVYDVFEHHEEMLLKRKHIVVSKINWTAKSENLKAISHQLDISLSNFIFIDDSAHECEEVLSLCPEILTLRVPDQSSEIPEFLDHIWAFDRLMVVEEDKKRNEFYVVEQQRKNFKQRFPTLEEYISSLDVEVVMRRIEEQDLERASQLTFRTNQFNLNGIRLSTDVITAMSALSNAHINVMTVKDKFGDYGFVGLVIIKTESRKAVIENLYLSCRVLGRGVEEKIFNLICTQESFKGLSIALNYIPTNSNKPVYDFIQRLPQMPDLCAIAINADMNLATTAIE